jgi:hypothetical protein
VPGYFPLPNRVRCGRARYAPTGPAAPQGIRSARQYFAIRLILRLLVFAMSISALQGRAAAGEQPLLPMHFEWRQEGPPEACSKTCRSWISAVGVIASDTPAGFGAFVEARDVRGATLVLDSPGGSTRGAIALGEMVRNFDIATEVGRTIAVPAEDGSAARTTLSPDADCDSMCAFVLLAGVTRYVPPEASVRVHGIWFGDRRLNAKAASYSADDLAVLQQEVGLLAQYTVRMGGSIDLLEAAARIPPWEPLRLLSQEELRAMRLTNSHNLFDARS